MRSGGAEDQTEEPDQGPMAMQGQECASLQEALDAHGITEVTDLHGFLKAMGSRSFDRRLRTLLMRANGKKLSEIAAATGYSFSGIVKLVSKYRLGFVHIRQDVIE